ncbi:hypothetical protein CAEBREN_05485 [Caenorhabditis brenneri]|uniref:Uncharacterized protein n=1 Tax=Caenorhabditis brenneri TaxID=135651 RepID=G0MAT0_CAEBE|nr:hypothetical protein CAEBREN_05485 [Caenorhabditis brenneri]
MEYRDLTSEDIESLLEMYGCSRGVVNNASRLVGTVNMFLEFKPFSNVSAQYSKEYLFFENHVLQNEVPFIDFYNGLLDRLEIKRTFNTSSSKEVKKETGNSSDTKGAGTSST